MLYAFDYDKTLTDEKLLKFAVKLAREGNEIWIVTMRKDNEFNNEKIKPVLKKLGLTQYSVIFCDEKPKWEWLRSINADVYIDNVTDEFEVIKNCTNTVPLLWI